MLFLGTYDYAMDDRGRVPLPPPYRDAFQDGVVLSQGSPDRCLRVYPQATFYEQVARVTAESPLKKRGRIMRRGTFPSANHAELDKQSRVLIPAPLRDFAGLSGKVLLVGAGEWMEIWSQEAWALALTEVDEGLEEAMESTEIRDQ